MHSRIRAPYGTSPSPTRRTFSTTPRRSMSPCALRPSALRPVKRKFELDDGGSISPASTYSPPPIKKMFVERGQSPVCQLSSVAATTSLLQLASNSPDLIEGRTTPKLYLSKLFSTGLPSSLSSSPSTTSAPSPSMELNVDLSSSSVNFSAPPTAAAVSAATAAVAIEPMATSDDEVDDDDELRKDRNQTILLKNIDLEIDDVGAIATTKLMTDEEQNSVLTTKMTDEGVKLPDDFGATAEAIISEAVPVVVAANADDLPTTIGSDIY